LLFWRRRIEPVDRLIVGIGNPGPEYAKTRHNVGFRVLDALAKRLNVSKQEARFRGVYAAAQIGDLKVGLLKPLTYVNLSGQAVSEAVKKLNLQPEQILVVLDDAQLPLGKLRMRPKGSSGGHKGLQSIIDALQTEEIPRLGSASVRRLRALIWSPSSFLPLRTTKNLSSVRRWRGLLMPQSFGQRKG